MNRIQSTSLAVILLASLALVLQACQRGQPTAGTPTTEALTTPAQPTPRSATMPATVTASPLRSAAVPKQSLSTAAPTAEREPGDTRGSVEVTAAPTVTTTRANRTPAAASPVAVSPAVGQPAPNFSLVDLAGRPVRLSDFRGRPVVVNFFATWCGPCREELPLLKTASQTYRDRGLTVLLIDLKEDPSDVRRFARGLGLAMPIVVDDRGTVAAEQYRLTNIPTTYFIDGQGTIRGVQNGPLTETTLATNVRDLLQGTTTTTVPSSSAPVGCCAIR